MASLGQESLNRMKYIHIHFSISILFHNSELKDEFICYVTTAEPFPWFSSLKLNEFVPECLPTWSHQCQLLHTP